MVFIHKEISKLLNDSPILLFMMHLSIVTSEKTPVTRVSATKFQDQVLFIEVRLVGLPRLKSRFMKCQVKTLLVIVMGIGVPMPFALLNKVPPVQLEKIVLSIFVTPFV